ncbi:hypothetical protein [Botrimarina mediterranea]|uniref:hypothetical protein n=1 Tax=Botrimarina mediterranea TaxID=2528022 RepID=UPI0011A4C70A|nr:hypothetical protein [Botrimarina mediterranea]
MAIIVATRFPNEAGVRGGSVVGVVTDAAADLGVTASSAEGSLLMIGSHGQVNRRSSFNQSSASIGRTRPNSMHQSAVTCPDGRL